MRDPRELLNIKHFHSRVGESLAKQELGLRPECGCDLLLGIVGRDKGNLYSHLRKSGSEQVECSSIDVAGTDNMVACGTNIQTCEKIGGLAG